MGQRFAKSYYVTVSIISLAAYIQSPQLQSLFKQQTGNEKVASTAAWARFYQPPGDVG